MNSIGAPTKGYIEMGSLFNHDSPSGLNDSIEKCKQHFRNLRKRIERVEKAKKSNDISNQQLNEMTEVNQIQKLLGKAGISLDAFYPYSMKKGKDGEEIRVFKNEKKAKTDAKKVREELQKALDKNKITQEEFDMLSLSLSQEMKDAGFEEEKEESKELSDADVEELYSSFKDGIQNNIDGLVSSMGEQYYEELCKEYEGMSMDERKGALQELNSKINTQVGVAGNISFVSNPNLEFENSFTRNGYVISEKDVKDKNLKEMTYAMVEKSMTRKLMIDNKMNLNPTERRALIEKIMQEHKLDRNQMMQNKQYIRTYKG